MTGFQILKQHDMVIEDAAIITGDLVVPPHVRDHVLTVTAEGIDDIFRTADVFLDQDRVLISRDETLRPEHVPVVFDRLFYRLADLDSDRPCAFREFQDAFVQCILVPELPYVVVTGDHSALDPAYPRLPKGLAHPLLGDAQI